MQRTLTDVENNQVRHWNVQHVLMWLKHTSNGMFEEYCPIFQENHVHGEALLSLNNEILRDEFEIKSYGKRFELLKAIQKLAKQASTSSSKASLTDSVDGRRVSRTYYKGMSSNKQNTTGIVSNDNWENLDIIASNTNILNSKEYTKVISDVVNEVTGTEISKQTREKHSFYRKLSNLTQKNTQKVVDKGTTQSKYGGYEYDINIPNWDTVPITKVSQHKWDEILRQWINKIIYVKISPLPFGRGSLRMSYYCLNLGDDIERIKNKKHIKQSKNKQPKLIHEMDEKNDTTTNNSILFNKLIGNRDVFGGKLCVAKKNFGICDSIEAYFYDVRTQCESAKYAKEYNKHKPPKKVAFLQASVIEIMGDNSNRANTTDRNLVECYCLESFLHGSYIKHIDNHGGDEKNRNTPSAFAHFSYECSNKKLLVCDIQGVGDLYTDPQIHTIHGKGFGMGNLGNDGIIKFFKTHECNAICKHFKFGGNSDNGINVDLIYGTRPDKQYMKNKRINVIDTKYIDNIPYLMQLPKLYHKHIIIGDESNEYKIDESNEYKNYKMDESNKQIVNVNNQINININHREKNIKEEKQRLLDNDNLQPPPPPKDAEDNCCACKCVIL